MKHSKTGLFLMELIVSILFFSLASAICVQIFTKVHFINEESVQKSEAIILASNIVEVYKNNNVDFTNDVLYFDDNGYTVPKEEAKYKVLIENDNNQWTIQVNYGKKNVYTLEYYHYEQRKW